MGDENSLAGTTKAHKHSALSSDGGFIEVGVTGMTNLSNGSIVYGNASEIVTELTAGSEGDALQISSGVPAWTTASGGGVEVLDSGQGVNSFDVGGSADATWDSYRFIQIFVSWESSATGSVSLQFYDTSGTISGATDYQRFCAVANQYVGSVYKETDTSDDLILTSNEINTGHYEMITFPVYPTFGTSINITWQTSSMPNGTLEMRTSSAICTSVNTNIRGITNNGTGIVSGTCNYTVLGIP